MSHVDVCKMTWSSIANCKRKNSNVDKKEDGIAPPKVLKKEGAVGRTFVIVSVVLLFPLIVSSSTLFKVDLL